eukprot:3290335-Amphidinium_carterae.1
MVLVAGLATWERRMVANSTAVRWTVRWPGLTLLSTRHGAHAPCVLLRSGLRLLSDKDRDNYLLAVE